MNFTFSEIKNIPNLWGTILYRTKNIVYLAFDQAPSKFYKFWYYIISSDKGGILKIKELYYNANYGTEICNQSWLAQFNKINSLLTYL